MGRNGLTQAPRKNRIGVRIKGSCGGEGSWVYGQSGGTELGRELCFVAMVTWPLGVQVRVIQATVKIAKGRRRKQGGKGGLEASVGDGVLETYPTFSILLP